MFGRILLFCRCNFFHPTNTIYILWRGISERHKVSGVHRVFPGAVKPLEGEKGGISFLNNLFQGVIRCRNFPSAYIWIKQWKAKFSIAYTYGLECIYLLCHFNTTISIICQPRLILFLCPGDRLVASLQIKGCFLYLYLASQTFTFIYCWIFTLHKYFTYYFYLFLGNGWSWWERCIRMKQKSVLPLQKVGRINLQD